MLCTGLIPAEHIENLQKTPGLAYRWNFTDNQYADIHLSQPIQPTLSYRRLRGDLIEAYKITNLLYDSDCTSCLKLWSDVTNTRGHLRGHSKKLFLQRSRLAVRENSFAIRVVPTWNKLPEEVVSAPDVNTFKNRLDNFMCNQDIMYNDHRATVNL